MFHKRKKNHSSFGKKPHGSFHKNRSFSKQRHSKKLDVNLFIKKAVPQAVEETEVTKALFTDYNLDPRLTRNITSKGFTSPTPIQEKAIPFLLQGRDVIGIANTGTGKTAAFLIPLIQKSYTDRSERVLIVTPTRELAVQIVDEFKAFAVGMNLDAVLCIGGANIQRQEKRLYHKPHFVIGTPGRLRDLINRKRLDLSLFKSIVLDEVDRMVDIGFLKDIEYLVSLLPQKRHSLFFSATVSDKAKGVMQQFVTDPVTVSVKQQATSENVDQDIVRVNVHKKLDTLHDLLVQDGFDKVLIFGRTKYGIEKLSRSLADRGFKATAIHGNKTQGQRQRALMQFKHNEVQILLATDVASRGLDIDNVTHVINYDPPENYDDYVHRIGRTGRGDKKGVALTFVE
jgi:ATP-dependent RNA helicase RhlE